MTIITVYSVRCMMKSMDEFKEFLADLRKETGLNMLVADDSGLVTISVDGTYNLNLQYIEETSRILCFVELVELPKDAPRSVYRDLLVGGLFGRDTAGGYFSLEDESETVVYNYFFDEDTAAKDQEEFVSMLEKILQLCDMWIDRINSLMHGEKQDTNPLIHQNYTTIRL